MPAPVSRHHSPWLAPASALLLLWAAGPVFPAVPGQGAADPAALVVTGSGPLEARTELEKLTVGEGPDGRAVRQFVPAQSIQAGEEVHYTIRVTNPGTEPVSGVVVTRQLPSGVDYVKGSAVGPACDVQVSTDGGLTFVPGRSKGTYTHVRWVLRLPLAPGATALLRFRAVFR